MHTKFKDQPHESKFNNDDNWKRDTLQELLSLSNDETKYAFVSFRIITYVESLLLLFVFTPKF